MCTLHNGFYHNPEYVHSVDMSEKHVHESDKSIHDLEREKHMQEYTVKLLMDKMDMSYDHTYGLIRRMRDKGLIEDIKKTRQVGPATNAKRYGLLMDPIEFVREEREQNPSPPPPPAFFNNPFNLREVDNLRLEQWKHRFESYNERV